MAILFHHRDKIFSILTKFLV